MPKSYQEAPAAVYQMISAVVNKYHKRLADDEITFAALMAYAARDKNDEPVGNAITVSGCKAAACVRATTLIERTLGMADVLLQFDGDKWGDWSEERQRALIDHELTHVLVRHDDNGKVKRDDAGRPQITLRAHDWEIVGFTEVVRRHGAAAFEATAVQQVAAHLHAAVQLQFEFDAGTTDFAELEIETA